MDKDFEIFLATAPGLETPLAQEAVAHGFSSVTLAQGGVTIRGGWPEVWRANLVMRGANRVLARIGSFRVMHLAQLDKRARKFAWGDVLQPKMALRVEVVCRKSRIYHAGAAAQRIETALKEETGAVISKEADLKIMVRIEDDLCVISLDTSGTLLHKRGHKVAVNKAPMRETLAAMFLRQCGYDGHEPVVDFMCGSGTFVLEAAEMAMGLAPGRSRSFAFEQFNSFDAKAWQAMQQSYGAKATALRFYGSDRDAGAVRMSKANAERAGVAGITAFDTHPLSEAYPPEGPKGLVMINPPYGARIGNKKILYAVYAELGAVLKARFRGWRVGMITSEPALAKTTGLKFLEPLPSVSNGGLRISLYRTGEL